MPKLLKWFWILNKRLYKKASFIAILVLLFLAVCLFAIASQGDSGFVHVVLAQTDKADTLSSKIINDLLAEDSLILFTVEDTPEQALEAVKMGQADSAWIFPEDMAQQLSSFVSQKDGDFIRVVEREQTVFSRLSREKLHAALYNYSAKAFFIDYTRDNIPELNNLSDEELLNYYDECKISKELFVFGNPPSASSGTAESHYLTAPLRGLLGIITVLSGLAAALHYMQDEKKHTFAWVPQKNRWLVGLACISVSTINTALISMIALCVSGLYAFHVREVICALLFALCCASFCLLLKQVFRKIPILGSTIPVFIAMMTCICPVFFVIDQVRLLSFLFPPTYYIHAAYNNSYMAYMLVYVAVCLALSYLLEKLKRGKA